MKLTHFEGRLFQQLEKAIFNVTPGVQVQVFQSGKKVCDISVGQTYFYYDYALRKYHTLFFHFGKPEPALPGSH